MDASFIIVGKFLLSSGLLIALYWFILRNKASYRLSRVYLVTLPILSAMMSGLTFDITLPASLVPETTIEQQETGEAAQNADLKQEPRYFNLEDLLPAASHEAVVINHSEPRTVSAYRSIDYAQWAGVLFAAVSVILLLLAIYYVGKMLWLKSHLNAEKTPEGYDLIRSATITTPFSFGRSIFMPDDLDAASERMILSHEKAHIAHGHYLEVWLMEFLTRLLWFNPVVWLCRSELSNVHEFEADRDVINQGTNLHAYQATLLEMVMSEGCPVVNGFNKSFIRQRFIEMKKTSINTLGLVGKCFTVAAMVALTCLFTISCKSAKSSLYSIPALNEPQLFVIEGVVDENIADSCYNIYLADEYFHIEGETPDTCVQVVDKRFHYEIPLTKVTAGRVRCIFPGNELCSAWIELWFVPGQTVQLNVHNGNYDLKYLGENGQYNYVTKIERALNAVRRSTELQTPYFTEPKAKKTWKNVEMQDLHRQLDVRKVLFNDDETILQLTTDQFVYSTDWGSNLVLTDSEGKQYKYLRSLTDGGDGTWSKETVAFGAWYAFEALPKNIDSFSLSLSREVGGRTYTHSLCKNISEGAAPKHEKPNFTLRISASEGIGDCGYLVYLYDKIGELSHRTQMADLQLDENRSCTFTCHLDEPRMGTTIATFPGGTICTHCECFPFMPGEEAELRVYNGYFHLTGTGPFYKAWAAADEYCENIEKYRSAEEAHSLMSQYLREHGNEEGCLRWFDIEMEWPKAEIYEAMSEDMKNSDYGFRLQSELEWHRAYVERESKNADKPLYIIRFKQDGRDVEGQISDDSVESIWDSPDYEKVAEYKGDDPNRPMADLPRSKNGVIVFGRKEKK